MIEELHYEGKLLAIFVRSDFHVDGIRFVTSDDSPQQLGFMSRHAGYKIQPHIHLPRNSLISATYEVLIVKSGLVRIDFYNDDELYIESRTIATGDVVLLASCGHGFEMLEDSELIEVKQGPYEADKHRFNPRLV